MSFYTIKLGLIFSILIQYSEVSLGQIEPKIHFIDSVVTGIDSMKGTSNSIIEGGIRPQYKSRLKYIFRKRRKGYFADWFIGDPRNFHLLKVFNEMSLPQLHYTTYYFLTDSLICAKLTHGSSGGKNDSSQMATYYFENGVFIYKTGQTQRPGRPDILLANARNYILEFRREKKFN